MRPHPCLLALTLPCLAAPAAAQITTHVRTLDVDSNVYETAFDGTDSANDFASTVEDGSFDPELDATSSVPFMSSSARAGLNSSVQAGDFGFAADGFASAGITVQGTAVATASNAWTVSFVLERSGALLVAGDLSAGTTLGNQFGFDAHGEATVALTMTDALGNVLFQAGAELQAGETVSQQVQLDEALGLPAGEYTLDFLAAANDATVGIEEVVASLSAAQYDLTVEIEPVELLVADVQAISAALGGAQQLSLDAGPASGGNLYLTLGSASGTAPGITANGLTLPLNPDAYFNTTVALANVAPFNGTLGLLDGQGQASASIAIPAGVASGLVGLELNHAYVVVDPSGTVERVSNSVPLTFQ